MHRGSLTHVSNLTYQPVEKSANQPARLSLPRKIEILSIKSKHEPTSPASPYSARRPLSPPSHHTISPGHQPLTQLFIRPVNAEPSSDSNVFAKEDKVEVRIGPAWGAAEVIDDGPTGTLVRWLDGSAQRVDDRSNIRALGG